MAKPIPDGYHSISTLLNVKNAEQAIAFYQKAFGAEVKGRMHGPDGKVVHAELKIGDSILMLSEAAREPESRSYLHLYVLDADASFQRAVAAGATVKMPLTDMFWGDRFGRIADPYGNVWAIATHKQDVPEADLPRLAAEFAKKMSQH
jgi:PhnB protein